MENVKCKECCGDGETGNNASTGVRSELKRRYAENTRKSKVFCTCGNSESSKSSVVNLEDIQLTDAETWKYTDGQDNVKNILNLEDIHLIDLETIKCLHGPDNMENISALVENDSENISLFRSSKTIELIDANLKEIITNFKKLQDSREKFLKLYPSWSEKRKKSIQKLKELAEDIDKIKFDCNVAKIIGSSVATAGGILSIVAAALVPFTVGLTAPIMAGGVVATGLGGTASIGTGVAEMHLLQRKVKAAQLLLKEDEDDFGQVCEWFQHTASYIQAFEKLLGINVVDEMCDTKTLLRLLTLYEGHHSLPKELINAIPKSVCVTLSSSAAPLTIIIAIATNRHLMEMLHEIIALHRNNPFIFEAAAMAARTSIQVLKGLSSSAECYRIGSSAAKLGMMSFNSLVGKAVSQGLFAGIGLAIEVTSLTLTSLDIRKGSHCAVAESIREVAEKLSCELSVLEQLPSELTGK